ncbi:MAG TPA: YdiU family protein [Burkholderiales bacterium]|nr:YdiU family protein [Burkholderiales bacterium]
MSTAAVKLRAGPLDLGAVAFENTFVGDLPGDAVLVNVPRQVSNACYTRVDPTPVAQPRLLAWSDSLAGLLGVSRPGPQALEVLAGNRLLGNMQPYAARYGGHQFGHWAGQLGDGRAITLAEMIAPDGSRQELQLKGAGRTPYSRTADGRAVLRSSLREFACSEAMFHLGVLTTRALSLVATGEAVIRDMFYDGHPQPEPGAVVCRVAPSFVRFGNFQMLAANNELEPLKRLIDYVVREHFPGRTPAEWYHELCRRTALLMVDWMRLGFVHGVMNTDNMSALGLTIDYGPYGWLEGYDPMWTPNTTDAQGRRYCYGNQPGIAQWNLARLAEALLPVLERPVLEEGLNRYADTFNEAWREALREKLGLRALVPGDDQLTADLLEALAESETDFTIFFRRLADVPTQATDEAMLAPLEAAFYVAVAPRGRLLAWLRRFGARVQQENEAPQLRRQRMHRVNPKYVFRNYLAQQAIDAMQAGDASVLERLMRVLERPYDDQPENEDYAARRPEWARHKAGCSALSCSS